MAHLTRTKAALAAIVLLTLPLLWYSLIRAPALRIDVGEWGDHTFLSGTHAIEQSPNETYRWTTGQAQLAIPNLSGNYQNLRLRAYGWRPDGSAPPVVQLSVAGMRWGQIETAAPMRIYQVLLPHDALRPTVQVEFDSPLHQESGGRQLGFAIDWIELRAVGQAAFPALWQLGGQLLLLALLPLLLALLALPRAWTQALAIALAIALVWANMLQPLWISQVLWAWLALAIAALAATIWLRPAFQRWLAPWMPPTHARAGWALLVLTLLLRLAFSIHPLFNAHDIDVHTGWISAVERGQLYLYSTPGEFHGRQTFNPPAGYVLMLPLALIWPDARIVVQAAVALLDALGCAMLLPLARELRLPSRAALIALALYIAIPINTTMLWWGFATNAMAQSLWLIQLWLMLRLARAPRWPNAALFVVASVVALMTHVGALVLICAMLGLYVLGSWRQLPARSRAVLIGSVAAAGVLAIGVYFSAAIIPLLGQKSSAPGFSLSFELNKAWAARYSKYRYVSGGLQQAFLPIVLALALPSLAGLLRPRRYGWRLPTLAACWLLTCVVFLMSDLVLGLVVRYSYFATPLLCLAVGALLASLWRTYGGRMVVLALTLFVFWSGAALWIMGVLLRDKPSVLPLVH